MTITLFLLSNFLRISFSATFFESTTLRTEGIGWAGYTLGVGPSALIAQGITDAHELNDDTPGQLWDFIKRRYRLGK